MMSFSLLLSPTGIFCVLNLVIGTIFVTSQLKQQKNRGAQPHHDHFSGHSPPNLARPPSFLERVRSINFSSYGQHEHEHQPQPFAGQDAVNSPARPPSFLERVRSINFSSYGQHEDEHQAQPFADQDAVNAPARPPSLIERVRSFKFSSYGQDEDEQQPEPFASQDAVNAPAPPQLSRPPSFIERVRSFKFSSIHSVQPDPVHHAVDRREVEQMADMHIVEPVAPAKMKKSASEKAMAVSEAEAIKQRSGSLTARAAPAAEEDDGVDEKANDFINRFRQQLKLQRMDSILRYREMLNRGASR